MDVKFLETQAKAKANFQYNVEKDFAVRSFCVLARVVHACSFGGSPQVLASFVESRHAGGAPHNHLAKRTCVRCTPAPPRATQDCVAPYRWRRF